MKSNINQCNWREKAKWEVVINNVSSLPAGVLHRLSYLLLRGWDTYQIDLFEIISIQYCCFHNVEAEKATIPWRSLEKLGFWESKSRGTHQGSWSVASAPKSNMRRSETCDLMRERTNSRSIIITVGKGGFHLERDRKLCSWRCFNRVEGVNRGGIKERTHFVSIKYTCYSHE